MNKQTNAQKFASMLASRAYDEIISATEAWEIASELQRLEGESNICGTGAGCLHKEAVIDSLKEQIAILNDQKNELLDALLMCADVASEVYIHWDNDRNTKVGKYLLALAGNLPRYDNRTDSIHSVIEKTKTGTK